MDRFHEILKQFWFYDDFRGIQAEIIESITSGNDTLGLMPTAAERVSRSRCRPWRLRG